MAETDTGHHNNRGAAKWQHPESYPPFEVAECKLFGTDPSLVDLAGKNPYDQETEKCRQ